MRPRIERSAIVQSRTHLLEGVERSTNGNVVVAHELGHRLAVDETVGGQAAPIPVWMEHERRVGVRRYRKEDGAGADVVYAAKVDLRRRAGARCAGPLFEHQEERRPALPPVREAVGRPTSVFVPWRTSHRRMRWSRPVDRSEKPSGEKHRPLTVSLCAVAVVEVRLSAERGSAGSPKPGCGARQRPSGQPGAGRRAGRGRWGTAMRLVPKERPPEAVLYWLKECRHAPEARRTSHRRTVLSTPPVARRLGSRGDHSTASTLPWWPGARGPARVRLCAGPASSEAASGRWGFGPPRVMGYRQGCA